MAIAVRFRCEKCRRWRHVREAPAETTCSSCGSETAIEAPSLPISRCVCCDGTEFFVRKDFPQKLGMAMVILFGLVASIFYYRQNVPATFATLAALVVVDAVIFLFVGKIVVCYKCRAEYRGLAYNSGLEGFDLATSEKYPT